MYFHRRPEFRPERLKIARPLRIVINQHDLHVFMLRVVRL